MRINKNEAYFIYGLVKGLCKKNDIPIEYFDMVTRIKKEYPQIEEELSMKNIFKVLHDLKKSGNPDIIKNVTGLFIKGVTC